VFFADVIFPVFTVPYLIAWGAPWALAGALLAEMVVFWVRRKQLKPWKVIVGTLVANAVSWFAGGLIAASLPFPNFGMSGNAGFHYQFGVLAVAFLMAYVLSTLIEFVIWLPFARKQEPFLFATTALANVASYLVLALAAIYFAVNGAL
jgi:hypothetical protein